MNIGEKTIEKMKVMAGEHLDTFAGKIAEAFLKSSEGKLKVTIAFDIGVSEVKPGGLDVDATISFTTEKIKEKISSIVVENQIEMPLNSTVYGMEK